MESNLKPNQIRSFSFWSLRVWIGFVLAFGSISALAQGRATETFVEISPDPSGQGGHVRAHIAIPASPAIVWRVMLDCANAPRFVPNLRSCAIESQDEVGQSDVRKHTIAWLPGFPLLQVRFVSRYQFEREIRFERISGDIAAMSGRWTLVPIQNGGATMLYYDAYLSPSRALPSALVRAGLRRDTPKILQAVKTEAVWQSGLK
jgi:ribosome-associated toxin RatA of RatAB toxin-antitoxin module